ncbi:hypothetical protein FB451DRAFT_1171296 [Mycena latifolia]|nr:hypothetical protein FB451DRAFT_1171296 [Mycena latifolia]
MVFLYGAAQIETIKIEEANSTACVVLRKCPGIKENVKALNLAGPASSFVFNVLATLQSLIAMSGCHPLHIAKSERRITFNALCHEERPKVGDKWHACGRILDQLLLPSICPIQKFQRMVASGFIHAQQYSLAPEGELPSRSLHYMHAVRRSRQEILEGLEEFEQFRGLGHPIWLWTSVNEALNATADELYGVLREKAVALRLCEVLPRRESEVECDEDPIDGELNYFWNKVYMTELFNTLIAVIRDYSIEGVGWKSARWEVYGAVCSLEHSRARPGL